MMRICIFFFFALIGVTAFGDIESFCGFQFGSVVQNGERGLSPQNPLCLSVSCFNATMSTLPLAS